MKVTKQDIDELLVIAKRVSADRKIGYLDNYDFTATEEFIFTSLVETFYDYVVMGGQSE